MGMYGFRNAVDKFLRYRIRNQEIRDLVIVILFITLTISFRLSTKVLSSWIISFFKNLIIVTISVLIFVIVQRFFALKTGHLPRYQPIWWALIIGLIISMLSDGTLWFFIVPGTLIIEDIIERHRIGYFRYGWSTIDWGSAAISGPLAALSLAIIFRIIYSLLGLDIMRTAMILNACIALINILPFPYFSGMYMAFAHRYIYFFVLVFIVLSSILTLLTSNLVFIILLPFIVAILVWVLIIKKEFID